MGIVSPASSVGSKNPSQYLSDERNRRARIVTVASGGGRYLYIIASGGSPVVYTLSHSGYADFGGASSATAGNANAYNAVRIGSEWRNCCTWSSSQFSQLVQCRPRRTGVRVRHRDRHVAHAEIGIQRRKN